GGSRWSGICRSTSALSGDGESGCGRLVIYVRHEWILHSPAFIGEPSARDQRRIRRSISVDRDQSVEARKQADENDNRGGRMTGTMLGIYIALTVFALAIIVAESMGLLGDDDGGDGGDDAAGDTGDGAVMMPERVTTATRCASTA